MTEHVVYLLGAGFSAPLGLPVMSNFLIRSRDLYTSDPQLFSSFGKVFQTIDALAKAKNYYAVDLFNIEEILSLLEMEDYAIGTRHRKAFVGYLRDVVLALLPEYRPHERIEAGNWYDVIFRPDDAWKAYCFFVANLFNLSFQGFHKPLPVTIQATRLKQPQPRYSIVTLNYDMLIERCRDLVQNSYENDLSLEFVRATDLNNPLGGSLPLAKLHGSAEPLTIVPPTWNKTARKEVRDAWRLGHEVLSTANQIRILGYSLPETDSYVRYLLESAAVHSTHLKNIDVLCLDPDGSVRKKYEAFLRFPRYRFKADNILKYLELAWARSRGTTAPIGNPPVGSTLNFDGLELAHEQFFSGP